MVQEKKCVLVTGASTGIGNATTKFLASKGFNVYAGARKKQDLEELNKIPNVISVKLDVTNSEDIKLLVKFMENQGMGLDGLVNNAGIAKAGPLMDLDPEELKEVFDVNLIGVHRVTQAVFPWLLESKGRIIMMSSDSEFFATPFFGPYCSSKFALGGYSDSLRRELLLYNVKVVKIRPGRVTTPIWDKGEGALNNPRMEKSVFKKEALEIGKYAIRKGKTAGLDPIEIAKVVYTALTCKKPKISYLVAPNPMKYRMIQIMPASSVDKKILKELKELKENA